MLRRHLSLALASTALVVACGTSDSASPSDASSGFVDRYCQAFEPCCAAAGAGTTARCKAITAEALAGRPFDAARGDACVASVQAVAAKGGFCDQVVALVPRCDGVFLAGNTKQLGESCTQNDCAPNAEGAVDCVNWAGGSACQLRIRGKDGSTPCVLSPASKPPPQRIFDCLAEDGLLCDSGGDLCVVAPARFEPCRGLMCEPSSRCDTGVNLCIARTGAGAPCKSDKECEAGLVCFADACTKPVATGAPCDETTGPCVATAMCRGGKCQPIASELGAYCGE